MKKIKLYFLTTLIVLIGNSCGDEFLEITPVDKAVLDDYYKTEEQIKSVTASLYSRPWFGFNDKFSWAAGDGMAGDLYNDYQDEGQLYFFSYSSTNSIVYSAWSSLFDVIAISNSVINDMPRIASKHGVSEEVINRGLGEARFMRAVAYFFLSEFWGDVPIVESPVTLISENNMELPRNTQASIYEFIRRDLVFAAENLPVSSDPGRVTTWSAKGLLAKLHVTLGHYKKSQADFDLAKSYAEDVIVNSGRTLMARYGDLFKIENNNNSESLFALQWANGNWGVGNSRQAVFARNAEITGNDECWGGGKSATLSWLQNWQENAKDEGGIQYYDSRQHDIVMLLGDHYPEIRKDRGGYTYNIVTVDPNGGADIEYAAPILNNIKKYIVGTQDDVGVPIKNQGVPLNQYMLRLADVYLLYTEAAIGLGNSTADAKALEYLNAVRTRNNTPTNGTSSDDLKPRTSVSFVQLMNERRVEFGMEGIAWYDVKRRFYRNANEAKQYLIDQNRGLTYEGVPNYQGDRNTYAAFQLRPPTSNITINDNSFRLPIPADELSRNPMFAAEPVEYVFE